MPYEAPKPNKKDIQINIDFAKAEQELNENKKKEASNKSVITDQEELDNLYAGPHRANDK